jgi:DNA-binding MarR family transcriptional regulator
MSHRQLTDDHLMILRYLSGFHGDDAWNMAQWVAERCGHAYDTPWASSRLRQLLRRGLVERGDGPYWRVTDAGRDEVEKAHDSVPGERGSGR